MKLKDYRGRTWHVNIEEWGHEGIPTDKYKYSPTARIVYAFVPVRFWCDEREGRRGVIQDCTVEAYLIGKWRPMVRFKRVPYTKITKYVAQEIVYAVSSNVGSVAERLNDGSAVEGELWISLVNYD